jgi:hypothetical protein
VMGIGRDYFDFTSGLRSVGDSKIVPKLTLLLGYI